MSDETNVIKLIQVNKFRHDGLSHISSLPYFKKGKIVDGKVNFSFDIKTKGDFDSDRLIGHRCSELIIKALHDDNKEICTPMTDIIFSLFGRPESSKALAVYCGFITGLFESLDFWLRLSAINNGDQLDQISYEQIIARIKSIQEA